MKCRSLFTGGIHIVLLNLLAMWWNKEGILSLSDLEKGLYFNGQRVRSLRFSWIQIIEIYLADRLRTKTLWLYGVAPIEKHEKLWPSVKTLQPRSRLDQALRLGIESIQSDSIDTIVGDNLRLCKIPLHVAASWGSSATSQCLWQVAPLKLLHGDGMLWCGLHNCAGCQGQQTACVRYQTAKHCFVLQPHGVTCVTSKLFRLPMVFLTKFGICNDLVRVSMLDHVRSAVLSDLAFDRRWSFLRKCFFFLP